MSNFPLLPLLITLAVSRPHWGHLFSSFTSLQRKRSGTRRSAKSEVSHVRAEIRLTKTRMEALAGRDNFAEFTKCQRQLNKLKQIETNMELDMKQAKTNDTPFWQTEKFGFMGDLIHQIFIIFLFSFIFNSSIITFPLDFISPLHRFIPLSLIMSELNEVTTLSSGGSDTNNLSEVSESRQVVGCSVVVMWMIVSMGVSGLKQMADLIRRATA
eukprot:GHVN01075526.1.p1 GENE.GHVN01075526.1~~GHVN01075526.1.p1  ORF type:complete len:213 (-),score=61.00 GHVN01075526.1:343-981(-)